MSTDTDIKFLHLIESFAPGMSLSGALSFLHQAKVILVPQVEPDFTTHEGRVAFARTQANIVALIKDDRFIQAIKDFRARTGCGLKESKDALDVLKFEFQDEALDGLRKKLTGTL